MSASYQQCKTELFIALENGDTEQVTRMVRCYPQLLNVRAANGWPPLMFAARYSHYDIVKFLVESGAQLDPKHLAQVV